MVNSLAVSSKNIFNFHLPSVSEAITDDDCDLSTLIFGGEAIEG